MQTTESPASLLNSYERDGYWIAPDLLGPQECDELKSEGLRVLDVIKNRQKAHTNSVYLGIAHESPLYHRLASDSRVVSVLGQLMPEGVMFMSDKLVFKSGDQKFATPWHIDAFYWRNTRPKISVWIPLDDVSETNGTLKVLPGSHHKEWVRGDNKSLAATNNEFPNVLANRDWKDADEVNCRIGKGSAVFFSDRLLHASCTNESGMDRYAIISTYHAPAEDEEFDRQFPARHVIIPRPASAG